MKKRIFFALMLMGLEPVLGCAAPQPPTLARIEKHDTCSSQILERLYFGLDTPHGSVSEAQWQKFLSTTVTPAFPAGLTVVQARGQWLGNDGKLVHESSRILELVHTDSPKDSDALAQIISIYKASFQQDAVMRVRTPVDACF